MYKYISQCRLTQPFICWCFSGPKGVNWFVFLELRRISRLFECSKYFKILTAFQGIYLVPVLSFSAGPNRSSGIWAFCDHEGEDPVRRTCLRPGRLSGILLWSFRVALRSTGVSFYLRSAAHGRNCFSLKSSPSKAGMIQHLFPSYPFLNYLALSSTGACVITHWLNKFIECLPGTILVGYHSEQNWWNSCPHRAWGFKGYQGNYPGSEVILSQASVPQGLLDTFRQLYLDHLHTTLKRHEKLGCLGGSVR